MSLLDRLIANLAPHTCCGCGKLGFVLCSDCANMVQILPPRCYRCQKSSPLFRTCKSCRSRSSMQSVFAWGDYSDVLKQTVRALKYERMLQAAKDLVDTLPLPDGFLHGSVLVPVPTTVNRVRQRGYDQADLLAYELGQRFQLPVHRILSRVGSAHQVGASGTRRREQLAGVFKVTRINERKVILVDDVLTTGSTLEEAARTLKKAGCRQIQAIVIAQA